MIDQFSEFRLTYTDTKAETSETTPAEEVTPTPAPATPENLRPGYVVPDTADRN